MPIDILAGTDAVRAFVDGQLPWRALDELAKAPADWWQQVRRFLLY